MSTNIAVEWGDFTTEVEAYAQRPPYSDEIISCLSALMRSTSEPVVAEVGAGTGNLLRSLEARGLGGFAIEPNDAMRRKGIFLSKRESRFKWFAGRGENVTLPNSSVDWLLVGNAFQFMKPELAVPELRRVLRLSGLLTIMWLLRDFTCDPIQFRLEQHLRTRFPTIRRIAGQLETVMAPLVDSQQFRHVMTLEAAHTEMLSPDRLMSVWSADHDAPSQVDARSWQDFLTEIRSMIPQEHSFPTHWRTKCWAFRPVG